jgi:hypothetical protein
MEDYQTWRDLLSNLIKERRERERIAKTTGVDALTLVSWATNATTPTSYQLHRLLQAIPRHQMLLRTLIVEEFEEFDTDPIEATAGPIPITFPAHVLEILANAPEESRFWSICTAVLHEAVHQLASTDHGISLSVIQCMPPSSSQEQVHCLREYIALGTSPWLDQVEMRTRFLGAESLAGTTVSSALPCIIVDSNQEHLLATYLPEYAMSAAAFPITHSNRIAGCLLVASTQIGYLSSSTHQQLMQNYAALLALAFSPANFYGHEQIALQIMPPLQVQQPYLSTLQQRVLATLQTAFSVNRSLSYLEAQQHVYDQIAQELLQIQPPV